VGRTRARRRLTSRPTLPKGNADVTTQPVQVVRRPTRDRIPLVRRPFTPQPRWRMPRWVRRLLRWLLVLLLILVALASCRESRKPSSLTGSTLAGPRLITGPICIEEAVDVSGSMTAFTAQRERAERALFDFARRELSKEDLFAEAFFAGSAKLALPPSSSDRLAVTPSVPDGIDYTGTNLAPAVDALAAARSRLQGRCAARALVIITDGLIFDPDAAAAALRNAVYTRVFAVIPAATGWRRPGPLRGGPLDAVSVYHFGESGLSGRAASVFAGSKPLDVVFGDIVGSLTGQKLVKANRQK
jgi:hypothetical protein